MIESYLKCVDDSDDDVIDKTVRSSKEVYLKYLHDETYQKRLLVILEQLN